MHRIKYYQNIEINSGVCVLFGGKIWYHKISSEVCCQTDVFNTRKFVYILIWRNVRAHTPCWNINSILILILNPMMMIQIWHLKLAKKPHCMHLNNIPVQNSKRFICTFSNFGRKLHSCRIRLKANESWIKILFWINFSAGNCCIPTVDMDGLILSS